jgi:hypothetical protein
LIKVSKGSIAHEPPPADSEGGNMEIAARERYVWYGSRKRFLRACSNWMTVGIPTCVFSRCLGDATKPELTVSKERSKSDVIYQLCCTENLFGEECPVKGIF